MQHFYHDYQDVLQDLRLLRGQVRRQRTKQRSSVASTAKDVQRLEAGLGRVALLVRALAELALERGLVSADDLNRKLKEVDAADGAQDEVLDPRVVMPGESKLAELEPLVPTPVRKPRRSTRKRR